MSGRRDIAGHEAMRALTAQEEFEATVKRVEKKIAVSQMLCFVLGVAVGFLLGSL